MINIYYSINIFHINRFEIMRKIETMQTIGKQLRFNIYLKFYIFFIKECSILIKRTQYSQSYGKIFNKVFYKEY